MQFAMTGNDGRCNKVVTQIAVYLIIRGGVHRFLARAGRKQAIATKLRIY
jgi:hypothetical protein